MGGERGGVLVTKKVYILYMYLPTGAGGVIMQFIAAA
jgi:hypothetical protein